jgi:hypothetical protein
MRLKDEEVLTVGRTGKERDLLFEGNFRPFSDKFHNNPKSGYSIFEADAYRIQDECA